MTGLFSVMRLAKYCALLILITFPAKASTCMDSLERPRENSYNPILSCSPSNLAECFFSPPLLLALTIPSAHLSADLAFNSPRAHTNLISLLSSNSQGKPYWKAVCTGVNRYPYDLYDCTDPTTKTSIATAYPVYSKGISYPSYKKGFAYSVYLPSSLSGYYAEYLCDASNPNLIQLRQYHVGIQKMHYFNSNNVLSHVNTMGDYSLVLRISYIHKKQFKAKSNRKKLGFSGIDPAAITPLTEKFVPSSLR